MIETLEITGSGKRFEKLSEQAPSSFSIMSENDNKLKVYLGEDPDHDVNIWIMGSFSNKMEDIIIKLKAILTQNRNLEMVAVEDVYLSNQMPNYCFLMARDEVLRSFQDVDDLNNYLLDRFRLNLAL